MALSVGETRDCWLMLWPCRSANLHCTPSSLWFCNGKFRIRFDFPRELTNSIITIMSKHRKFTLEPLQAYKKGSSDIDKRQFRLDSLLYIWYNRPIVIEQNSRMFTLGRPYRKRCYRYLVTTQGPRFSVCRSHGEASSTWKGSFWINSKQGNRWEYLWEASITYWHLWILWALRS